jgi:tripartite-type tricarboxylate transporter receptor subunit TctC
MNQKASYILVLLLLAVSAWPVPAVAQTRFPSKPVRLIVPTAGGTNDTLARLIAPKLSEALSQPVIVETKAGAGGNLGAEFVARSEPDGHTLLIGYNGPIANNISLFESLPFDPVKDFAPITLAVTAPQLLVINPKVAAANIQEFIALARSRAGQLNYGSVGPGSGSHLAMEWLKSEAGINLLHVPYKGAAPALTDLLGGTVEAGFFVPGNVLQYAKAGRLRVLASSGRERFKSTPDAPTLVESGFPDFVALAWIGLLAPAATPPNIVQLHHREITRILKQADVHEKLRAIEFDVVASTPTEFAEFIRTDIARWATVIKKTGARAAGK